MESGRDDVVASSERVRLAELGAGGQRSAVQLQQQFQLGALAALATTWSLGVIITRMRRRPDSVDDVSVLAVPGCLHTQTHTANNSSWTGCTHAKYNGNKIVKPCSRLSTVRG